MPPLVSFLSTHPAVKSDYLKSVVAVTGGAAPFGPALIEKFMQKCAPNKVSFREGIKSKTKLRLLTHINFRLWTLLITFGF